MNEKPHFPFLISHFPFVIGGFTLKLAKRSQVLHFQIEFAGDK